jgi:hypothetical protein
MQRKKGTLASSPSLWQQELLLRASWVPTISKTDSHSLCHHAAFRTAASRKSLQVAEGIAQNTVHGSFIL